MNIDEMRKRATEGAALAEKATPGPWQGEHGIIGAPNGGSVAVMAHHTSERTIAAQGGEEWNPRDEQFIADARTRVPALVGDVLALIAEVERLRGEKSTLTAMEEHAREERDAAKAEVERLRAILAANEAEAQRSAAIADANTARGAAIRERKLGA